jgi:D-alanyl-D-alanine carboxypeptidase/D-alanyl-D-alanine-endopeptidase (penicillin-binding protein 4)
MRISPHSSARGVLGVAIATALAFGSNTTASASLAPEATGGASTTAAVSTTVAVSTYTTTAADQRIASKLTARVTSTRFGTAFSGAVLDAGSNTTVWRKNGETAYKPASANKLVTASNALTLWGPDARFLTRVRTGSAANRVILQGSGDPSLSSGDLDRLAATTAAWMLARTISSVRVYADDDVFPTPSLAYGWKESYVPDSISPVRALVRDQRSGSDTSAEATRYFRDRLKAHGITTAGYYGRADAAAGSTLIAKSSGAALSTTVSRMLLNSDNEIAEALHKMVGRKLGYGSSWSGARAAQAHALGVQGLQATTLYDGSGLSRADRLSALQLARVVDRGVDPANLARLWPLQSAQAMPTAGRTGTLASRFTTTATKCAVGRVWAKTGTLSDVVSLAGFTTGTDGRVKVFAFVVNGKSSTTTLKQNIDMLAATVNGCY